MASPLSFLKTYPEILLSLFCFLLFLPLLKSRRPRVPTNWPLVGMLPALYANIHRLHDWGDDVFSECGCTFVFRGPWLLNMHAVATVDPANVRHVFTANFANFPKGGDFNQVFDVLGNSIFNSDGDSWSSQRRDAHRLISDRRFRSFSARSVRDKVGNSLLPLLARIAEQETIIDLQDLFLRLTFDTSCMLVLGVDPGCLAADFPTLPIVKAFDDIEQALFYRHFFPMILWKLARWMGVGQEKKLADGWRVIDRFLFDTITDRVKRAPKERASDEPIDLLTSYIDEAGDREEYSYHKFLRDTTLSLLIAGRDTTGVVLSWFFWLLSKNPDVETKILEELKFHDSRGDTQAPKVFHGSEIENLVYLHAALCECLRLYPPVWMEVKGVSKPDVLSSGVSVAPGTHLLFNVYSMGRMKSIWGEDCMEFKPERWITERGRTRHEPPNKFFSFNCGPRTCLGKEMAFVQLKAVVAAMVYNFRVAVVEGHVVEPKISIILHMKNGMMVRVWKRGGMGCS